LPPLGSICHLATAAAPRRIGAAIAEIRRFPPLSPHRPILGTAFAFDQGAGEKTGK
jgi:hypothetical protein